MVMAMAPLSSSWSRSCVAASSSSSSSSSGSSSSSSLPPPIRTPMFSSPRPPSTARAPSPSSLPPPPPPPSSAPPRGSAASPSGGAPSHSPPSPSSPPPSFYASPPPPPPVHMPPPPPPSDDSTPTSSSSSSDRPRLWDRIFAVLVSAVALDLLTSALLLRDASVEHRASGAHIHDTMPATLVRDAHAANSLDLFLSSTATTITTSSSRDSSSSSSSQRSSTSASPTLASAYVENVRWGTLSRAYESNLAIAAAAGAAYPVVRALQWFAASRNRGAPASASASTSASAGGPRAALLVGRVTAVALCICIGLCDRMLHGAERSAMLSRALSDKTIATDRGVRRPTAPPPTTASGRTPNDTPNDTPDDLLSDRAFALELRSQLYDWTGTTLVKNLTNYSFALLMLLPVSVSSLHRLLAYQWLIMFATNASHATHLASHEWNSFTEYAQATPVRDMAHSALHKFERWLSAERYYWCFRTHAWWSRLHREQPEALNAVRRLVAFPLRLLHIDSSTSTSTNVNDDNVAAASAKRVYRRYVSRRQTEIGADRCEQLLEHVLRHDATRAALEHTLRSRAADVQVDRVTMRNKEQEGFVAHEAWAMQVVQHLATQQRTYYAAPGTHLYMMFPIRVAPGASSSSSGASTSHDRASSSGLLLVEGAVVSRREVVEAEKVATMAGASASTVAAPQSPQPSPPPLPPPARPSSAQPTDGPLLISSGIGVEADGRPDWSAFAQLLHTNPILRTSYLAGAEAALNEFRRIEQHMQTRMREELVELASSKSVPLRPFSSLGGDRDGDREDGDLEQQQHEQHVRAMLDMARNAIVGARRAGVTRQYNTVRVLRGWPGPLTPLPSSHGTSTVVTNIMHPFPTASKQFAHRIAAKVLLVGAEREQREERAERVAAFVQNNGVPTSGGSSSTTVIMMGARGDHLLVDRVMFVPMAPHQCPRFDVSTHAFVADEIERVSLDKVPIAGTLLYRRPSRSVDDRGGDVAGADVDVIVFAENSDDGDDDSRDDATSGELVLPLARLTPKDIKRHLRAVHERMHGSQMAIEDDDDRPA